MLKEISYEDVYINTVSIANKLMKETVKYHNKPIPEIHPYSRLKEDLDIDSLDRVDFLLFIEDIYKVELINEESKKEKKDFYGTKTMEEFTWFIHKKLTGGYGELTKYTE